MNTQLFNSEVQCFIQENLKNNLNNLVLKGSPFPEVSTQELAQQIEGKQKAKKKLPLWFKTENIYYPKKLNLEQTSSESTALYKAKLIFGESIIDLTGGFGIDCTFFSEFFKEVHHCEMNSELSDIVTSNCQRLNIKNIITHKGDSLKVIKNLNKKFDWIYIDPSRRNDIKGKVFLLNDCLPNVPNNLDAFFEYSDQILIKISPILDITSTINELKFVKEIHIIALENEVKELLFILEKGYADTIIINTINILKEKKQSFCFEYGSTQQGRYGLAENYLYEPNAAIMKSGGFQEVSSQLNLAKLHQHSHLYTSTELYKDFPGRIFKIDAVLNYDKKKIMKLLPDKKANITTRNFPETVAQIRKKTKIKDGGNIYLFFTTNIENNKKVLACSKL
ncbi:class I SAM-dependent methyltransferase [Flavicella sp.]|uniref:class I SAM-dependent methyltransferase n=1 Tax=Flavicella sp. TaxID=2957742 RepID=UPI003019038F